MCLVLVAAVANGRRWHGMVGSVPTSVHHWSLLLLFLHLHLHQQCVLCLKVASVPLLLRPRGVLPWWSLPLPLQARPRSSRW